MPDGLGIAFPGQGIALEDLVAVLDAHQGHPLVCGLARAIGTPWHAIELADTRVSQPAVFVAGLVEAAAVDASRIRVAFGHSLGEVTAMAYAGALDLDDAVELVKVRGAVSYDAQIDRPGQMVAVMGLDAHDVEWVRRSVIARTGCSLEIAAVNGRRQTVLSGDPLAIKEVVGDVVAHNGICAVLPIGGAFHSPAMHAAIEPLRAAVERIPFKVPRVPVVSAFDCAPHDDPQELKALLWRALLLPVRWFDALDAVRALGVCQAIDAGPGRTLEKLARRGGSVKFTSIR